jgi:hypothetical protein
MSIDYTMVCYTCKETGPIFASASGSYGYKVWDIEEIRKWLGHGEAVGLHEGHDLRIVGEIDLPWDDDTSETLAEPNPRSGAITDKPESLVPDRDLPNSGIDIPNEGIDGNLADIPAGDSTDVEYSRNMPDKECESPDDDKGSGNKTEGV